MAFSQKETPPKAGTEGVSGDEANKESLSSPNAVRLLDSLERFWGREIRGHEPISYTQELDEIEIRNALSETYTSFGMPVGTPMEDVKKAVLNYHSSLQEIDTIDETLPQVLSEENLLELVKFREKVNKLLWRLDMCWYRAVSAYMRRLEMKENRHIRIEEEFGGVDISLVKEIFSLTPESRGQWLLQHSELDEAFERFHINQYLRLTSLLKESWQSLDNWTKQNPDTVKKLIARWHVSGNMPDSSMIDDLLGIIPGQTETTMNERDLTDTYGHHQYAYQGLPYDVIRSFLKEIKVSESDIVYDLGSGYGRIPLYGAMVTPAVYKGIEIVPERVVKANDIKNKFKLRNAEFQQGNVLEKDYSDGTVFYLFNPFTWEVLEKVGVTLKEIANNKKIRVVSIGPSTNYFQSQNWLRQVESDTKERPWGLTIFESK